MLGEWLPQGFHHWQVNTPPGGSDRAAWFLWKKHRKANYSKCRCGCRSTNKGTMRRLCRGFFPQHAEIQKKPLQPEPPNKAAARPTPKGQEGVRGESRFLLSPRRLCAAFDARKRLPTPISSKYGKYEFSISTHKQVVFPVYSPARPLVIPRAGML